MVAATFVVQNIVIVIFWSNLFMAGPGIKSIVDAAAPYLFAINTAQSGGLAMFMLDNKKIMKPSLLFVSIYVVVRWSEALINRPNGRCSAYNFDS